MKFSRTILLGALILVLLAYGGTYAADRNTLVVLSAETFTGSWFPTQHTVLANGQMEANIYDTLLSSNWETLESQAGLAYEWEFQEDGGLLLRLRQGVYFHCGKRFNARDAKATIEGYSRRGAPVSRHWRNNMIVEIIDDYTIIIRPESGVPWEPMLSLIGQAFVFSADDDPEHIARTGPNGTGPYRFVRFENEAVYLEAFDNHWNEDQRARIRYVEFRYVPDAATRLAALQSGEAHVIPRVESEHIPILEQDPNTTWLEVVTSNAEIDDQVAQRDYEMQVPA
jgi:peptide/nickel transport system substrate-binding protein